jgi:hypothetical protein
MPASQLQRITQLPGIQQTPTVTPSASSFVGDGTGQVQYGAQTLDNPAPAPIADTSIETLRLTPEYMARERALASELERFGQEQATEKTRFGTRLGESFTELGFDPTSGKFDLGELLAQGQRATVSGRAYDALRNDFAARGMLQSGAYQARRGVLETDLMGRKKALEDSRIAFDQDQQRALEARNAQAEAARTAALEEAKQAVLSRFAMGA